MVWYSDDCPAERSVDTDEGAVPGLNAKQREPPPAAGPPSGGVRERLRERPSAGPRRTTGSFMTCCSMKLDRRTGG